MSNWCITTYRIVPSGLSINTFDSWSTSMVNSTIPYLLYSLSWQPHYSQGRWFNNFFFFFSFSAQRNYQNETTLKFVVVTRFALKLQETLTYGNYTTASESGIQTTYTSGFHPTSFNSNWRPSWLSDLSYNFNQSAQPWCKMALMLLIELFPVIE